MRNGSFRQVMRQMEHERGGIDRLVSNRLLFESVRRSAWIDHRDALVRQELARLEIDAGGDLASRVARGVCYAPAYTIMGGTTQILRNIVGERMLGLPR